MVAIKWYIKILLNKINNWLMKSVSIESVGSTYRGAGDGQNRAKLYQVQIIFDLKGSETGFPGVWSKQTALGEVVGGSESWGD